VIALVYVAGAILENSKFGEWSRAIMLLVLGFAAYLAIGANWCQQAVKRRIAERRAKLDDDERPAASGLALAIPGAVGVLVVLAPIGVALALGLDWRRATRAVSLFWLAEVAAAVVYLRKYPSEYSEVVEVPGDVDDFMTRAADLFPRDRSPRHRLRFNRQDGPGDHDAAVREVACRHINARRERGDQLVPCSDRKSRGLLERQERTPEAPTGSASGRWSP
jgi:hypothetical protein